MDDFLKKKAEEPGIELSDNRARVGDNINILAKDPALKKLHVGVGWDLNAYDADAMDVDVSVFLLDKNGKTRVDEDFVFYNQMQTLGGAVRHTGDSRTGAGDGDDEVIEIDLTGVPFDIQKIMFALTLYRGEEKDQRLGQVQRAFLRLENSETKMELFRFELDQDLENKPHTGMLVASINREGPKWHFTPLAEFVEGGLKAIATRFGCVIVDN